MGEICWLVGTSFDSFAAALWICSQLALSSPRRSEVVRSVIYSDRSNLIPYPSGTHRASFVPIKIGSTFASFHVSINRCLMFESTSRDQIPTRYFSIFHVPFNLACFIPLRTSLEVENRFFTLLKSVFTGQMHSSDSNDKHFFSLTVVDAGTNDRVKSPNRDVGAGPQHGTKWWFNYNNRLLQWRVW